VCVSVCVRVFIYTCLYKHIYVYAYIPVYICSHCMRILIYRSVDRVMHGARVGVVDETARHDTDV